MLSALLILPVVTSCYKRASWWSWSGRSCPAICKTDPIPGYPVEPRCIYKFAACKARMCERLIIADSDKNVGLFILLLNSWAAGIQNKAASNHADECWWNVLHRLRVTLLLAKKGFTEPRYKNRWRRNYNLNEADAIFLICFRSKAYISLFHFATYSLIVLRIARVILIVIYLTLSFDSHHFKKSSSLISGWSPYDFIFCL